MTRKGTTCRVDPRRNPPISNLELICAQVLFVVAAGLQLTGGLGERSICPHLITIRAHRFIL